MKDCMVEFHMSLTRGKHFEGGPARPPTSEGDSLTIVNLAAIWVRVTYALFRFLIDQYPPSTGTQQNCTDHMDP